MVKYPGNDSQSSFGDVVQVFMSSFSETADAENTASVKRTSVRVVIKTARLYHSFTQRHAEHAGFLFK